MKNAQLASVVLVADAELSAERMERLQQGLKPVPLLVYVETRQALNRYVATQKAVWAAQARGPKQPNCGSEPEAPDASQSLAAPGDRAPGGRLAGSARP